MSFIYKNLNRRRILKIVGVAAIGSIAAGTILKLTKEKIYKVHWQGIALGAPAEITISHTSKNYPEKILEKSVNK